MKAIRLFLIFALACLLLGMVSGLSWANTPAAPEGFPQRLEPQGSQEALSLQIGDTRRTFLLYTPSSYEAGKPMPLVMAFHGYLGTGELMMKVTGFNELAEKKGFIVVYPDGLDRRWSAYTGPNDVTNRDMDFVRAVLQYTQHHRDIDPSRIYATGFSNGGFLSHRIACQMSDEIAAVATVGATIGEPLKESCETVRPISVLMINGTDDPVVTWKGEIHKVHFAFPDSSLISVPDMVSFWVDKNQCAVPPLSFTNQDVEFFLYQQCNATAEVRQIVIAGGGHTWPGRPVSLPLRFLLGRSTQSLDASLAIWEFFQHHPMANAPMTGTLH